MITIHNLKTDKMIHPWDVLIDRRTVWGNPFPMKNKSLEERDRVCDKYDERIGWSFKYIQPLKKLKELYKEHGKLRLFCWCAPLRCHGESIKRIVENEKT